MSEAGDVYENPVTGERALIRVGTAETAGELLVADLTVSPGGAVMGEHYHPAIEERFTVLAGRLGYRADGRDGVATPGQTVYVPAGMTHQWWNAGPGDALVRVEVRPAARFEECIVNAFGLAADGRTDAKGMPGLLQLAAFATEFADVIRFTRPPRWVQRVLFGLLAPVARRLGYVGNDPKYAARGPADRMPLDPLDPADFGLETLVLSEPR